MFNKYTQYGMTRNTKTSRLIDRIGLGADAVEVYLMHPYLKLRLRERVICNPMVYTRKSLYHLEINALVVGLLFCPLILSSVFVSGSVGNLNPETVREQLYYQQWGEKSTAKQPLVIEKLGWKTKIRKDMKNLFLQESNGWDMVYLPQFTFWVLDVLSSSLTSSRLMYLH